MWRKPKKLLIVFITHAVLVLILTACSPKIRLPTSLPYVMSALKISSSLAVVGAIVGEFVGANKGLGYVVLVSSYHMDTPIMFSAIIASAACGLLLFWSIGWLEKKIVFWQRIDEI